MAPLLLMHRPYLGESALPPALNAGLEWLPASPGAGSAALGTLGASGAGRGGVGTAVVGEACCVDCAGGAAVGMGGIQSCHIRRRKRLRRRRPQGWICDVSLDLSGICIDETILATKANLCRRTADVCAVPNANAMTSDNCREIRTQTITSKYARSRAYGSIRGYAAAPGRVVP